MIKFRIPSVPLQVTARRTHHHGIKTTRLLSLLMLLSLLFHTFGSLAVMVQHESPPGTGQSVALLEDAINGAPEMADELVPDELIVKFKRGFGRANRELALARVAARVRHFEDTNRGARGRRGLDIFDQLVRVRLDPRVGCDEAITELLRDPNVEYAEPNLAVHVLDSFPNDPDFNLLWGLHSTGQTGGISDADIDAPSAWDTVRDGSAVVVAVLDTGVEYSHPDLSANMWVNPDEIPGNGFDDDGNGFADDVHGYDFYNDDADPRDDHFHGTHVAGTIGAVGDNGIGVTGVNWSVQLMAVKFLSASGGGSTADAISAIQYAINNGADVMSNSWGGSGYLQSLQDVIRAAHDAGIVFVAAAGNNGNDSLVYPAAYDKVIAVSATDHNDTKASFSSYGAFVDVAAPGVSIFSTKLNGTYGYASGTSMACPHVSGVAALLIALDGTLSPDQVEKLLETSADDMGDAGWDGFYGSGRINAQGAVQTVLQQETGFPTAAIASPTHGNMISGTFVDILGTAAGSGFVDYTMEYAGTADSTWQLTASASSPVQDGLLASWDSEAVPDGDYLIRLTVTDVLDRKIYDVVAVTLDSYEAEVTFPTQLISMDSIDILGSAATKNGIPFDAYTLEWGVGSAPTAFSTAGISLAGGGLQPVTNGTLAIWDTSGLTDGQTYTLRLTVNAATGGYAETTVQTKADQDLVTGWPISLSTDSMALIVPTVADLDGDGVKEVITAGPDEKVQVRQKDGSDFPGFPVVMDEGDYFRWGINVDDLDEDGTKEIIAVVSNPYAEPKSRILILNHDGTSFPGWPTPGLEKAQSSSDITPSVADLNGDGAKELVLVEVFTWVDSTEVRLHAFNLDGTELTGFPRVHTLPPVGLGSAELYPSKHGVVSIADLDQDGYAEITWSYSNRVYLFDHQGNVLPGWPFIAPLYDGKLMLFENAAASADIDGDGQLELFAIGRNTGCGGGCATQLYGWRKNGSVLPGWPRTDQIDGIKLGNASSTQNTPAVVDIDGDGKDEILVGLDKLTVFDENGLVPFANTPISSHTQPAASDVDGDGQLEFSGNWYNTIDIADNGGASYWRRIMPSGGTRSTLGILADLDDDGIMELIVSHADYDRNITLFLWEIDGAGTGAAAEEWSMFNHDSARSGRQSVTTIDAPGDSVAPMCSIDTPSGSDTVSGTISVEASASDNVGVTLVKFYRSAELIGADSSEPYAIAWDTASATNGTHDLVANAYDAAGNIGASLPVTVTVNNDTTPPNTPTLVSPGDASTTADSTPTFDWSDVTDPSGIRYRLQVDNDQDFSSPVIDVGDLVDSIHTLGQALSDGAYVWRVLAVDGVGNASAWSNVRTLTVATEPPPAVINAPSSLQASISGDAVTLTWIDNSDNEEGFTIERGSKTKGRISYTVVGQAGANANTYTETAAAGTTYYRVQTFNQTSGLVSAYSNEVSVKVSKGRGPR